jgi:hypothetical protein
MQLLLLWAQCTEAHEGERGGSLKEQLEMMYGWGKK